MSGPARRKISPPRAIALESFYKAMARDDKTPSEENSGTKPPGKFAGEEEVDEWASPQKNLAATAF